MDPVPGGYHLGMGREAFIQPGVGSSDALIDWLEQHEIVVRTHDVTRDEGALATAMALGGGRLPVYRVGDRVVAGFLPDQLEALGDRSQVAGGLRLETGPEGGVLVREVLPGSIAETAGLQSGDVVVKLGGYTQFSVDQFRIALERPRTSRLAMEVRRGEDILTLRVETPLRG